MVTYQVQDVSADMSFLEMLDLLNEDLTVKGEEPVAFDHDCREGICGMCGVVINGTAHGRGESPVPTTTCQLHMRSFADGATIDVEPWRAGPFPVIKDLAVDRSAFDRIIQAGGFISANTGAAPEAHAAPVAQAEGRPCLRRCHLHRLWRLCGGLPELLGHAVHRGEDHPPGDAPAGPAGAVQPDQDDDRARTTPRASAAAPTSASARRSAPSRSRSTRSASSTAT